MKDEKVTKIKRQIARLSFEELRELEKYVRKVKDRKSRQRFQEAKLENFNRLRALEPGTKVVVTETRSELTCKIGIIERHLGGKSQRTVVKFDDNLSWRIPTLWLSDDVSELNLNRIKQNIGLSNVFNRVFSKM